MILHLYRCESCRVESEVFIADDADPRQAVRAHHRAEFLDCSAGELALLKAIPGKPHTHYDETHAAKVAELAGEYQVMADNQRFECLDRRDWGTMRLRTAALRANLEPGRFLAEIRQANLINNRRWVYAGCVWGGLMPRRYAARAGHVVFSDRGERWESVSDAARELGSAFSTIRMAVNKGWRCKGRLLRYGPMVRRMVAA